MTKLCIAGKNNIAVDTVDYLLNDMSFNKKNLYIIPNKTDNGNNNWQRSLLKYARQNQLTIATLNDVYKIKKLIFISLEFDRIINTEKFKTNQLYNTHFSLLPKYKGMFTSVFPILNNEKSSGVTFHKIDCGIDTGDIADQKKIDIYLNDNSRDLYLKYIKTGVNIAKKNLEKILSNAQLNYVQQAKLESSYYSKNSLDFQNLRVDLNQTAISIHNQIRAFNFREYQTPVVFGTSIISSEILNEKSKLVPGSILFEDKLSYVISTIDYNIILFKDCFQQFLCACRLGDITTVKNLINTPKVIDTQDSNGHTPLIVGICNNQFDVVTRLLHAGANTAISDFNGTTCLMHAKNTYVKTGCDKIFKLILHSNTDIYQKDFFRRSVLDHCIINKEHNAIGIITKIIDFKI